MKNTLIIEKKDGRTWTETYRNDDRESVLSSLASTYRAKLNKVPTIGRITDEPDYHGQGTTRIIKAYWKDCGETYRYTYHVTL